jgi:Rad3-related DNA helicase
MLDFSNAAIVIDEGHNIMDVCRESASTELSLKLVIQPTSSMRSLAGGRLSAEAPSARKTRVREGVEVDREMPIKSHLQTKPRAEESKC